jgi:hypothetical protein
MAGTSNLCAQRYKQKLKHPTSNRRNYNKSATFTPNIKEQGLCLEAQPLPLFIKILEIIQR